MADQMENKHTKELVHYGDPELEFIALNSGAALIDRFNAGRLRLFGQDVIDLMDRLTTNDLRALDVGNGISTVLTTNKGRVVDLLVMTWTEDNILCITSPERQKTVAEWIDFYTFSEDATVLDVSDTTAQFSLTGPKVIHTLSTLGIDVAYLPRFHSSSYKLDGIDLLLWHTLSAGIPTYEIILDVIHATAVREIFINAGVTLVGSEALEAHRILQGIPFYGSEFSDDTNPLECRLKGAISFNKGCYIGQEVVARLNTYKKVQRLLMGVTFSAPVLPGSSLLDEHNAKVGNVTSVARIPGTSNFAGLALVKQDQSTPGNTLHVSGETVQAVLAEPLYALSTEPQ